MNGRPSSTQLAALARAITQVYGKNIPDFDRAFEQLYTPFKTEIIDLGRVEGQSALGDVRGIAGDFVYIDPDQSALNGALGTVTLEANDKTAADICAFTANPGFAVNMVFTSLKFRYTSQPGKRLVVKYSTGYSVIPSFAALTAITSAVDLSGTTQQGIRFSDADTAANTAFLGTAVPGPVAAQFSFGQVWNPPGSGKILYVDKFEFSDFTATDRVELRDGNASLGVLGTNTNKNDGGAAPAGQFRNGSTAAPGGTVIANSVVIANTVGVLNFDPPIRLVEGRGVFILNFTVNHLLGVTAYWRERTT